jgi:hypothetical protein
MSMTRVDSLLQRLFDQELEERTLARLREVKGAPVKALWRREVACRDLIDRVERVLASVPLDDE